MSLSKTSTAFLDEKGSFEESDDTSEQEPASREGSIGVKDSSIADTNQTGPHDEDIQNIKNALSKRESQLVFRLRALVIVILLLVAVSVSVTVFYQERGAQIEQFEEAFYGVAEKIVHSLEEATDAISGLSALAVMAALESEHQETENLTSDHDHASFSGWPFVTIDAFQERANNVRYLSKSIYVSVSPIVSSNELSEWEEYVLSNANTWIAEGMQLQKEKGIDTFVPESVVEKSWLTNHTVDPLHTFGPTGIPSLSRSEGPLLPRWQTSPVLPTSMVNENLMENPAVSSLLKACVASKSVVLGGFHSAPPGSTSNPDATTSLFATLLSMWEERHVEYFGDPVSHVAIPIFDQWHGVAKNVVGVVESFIYWRWFITEVLPEDEMIITVVIENNCTGSFTYQVNGPLARAVGAGDRHDPKYSEYRVAGSISKHIIDDGTSRGIPFDKNSCPYMFHVYPAQDGYSHFVTNQPVVVSVVLAIVFGFTIGMFLIYDQLVERRQRLLLAKATQSTAIVSSLFPKQVRDRLLAIETQRSEKATGDALMPVNHRLRTFLNGNEPLTQRQDRPIADFFPNCTVFFGDIAGFTAWSSTREPTQVFILLQTVYQNFDAIAKRRKVFKVETIGDSYVAVTGLPEPQPSHAVLMVRFAWDCLVCMGEITKELEVTLGPDTNDLSMRFGLHSGSVTAGVLKGDRARFQLFGDTVNTASRMESTGTKGRIQVSETTAELIRNDGKGSWLTPRSDRVNVKGKGALNTYWVALKNTAQSVGTGSSNDDRVINQDPTETPKTPTRHQVEGQNAQSEARLIDWITEVLLEKITILAWLRQLKPGQDGNMNIKSDLFYVAPEGIICLDEVQDTMVMPEFNADVAQAMMGTHVLTVPQEITTQLREYVALVARSYRPNPFHNFEHACHVVMSVSKLLRRIVVPDLSSNANNSELEKPEHEIAADIHNFTHGLISDPMASFALIFSALIHDADHQGVSNAQLIKEEPTMGEHYRNRCVAEQNSLDVAWDLFMSQQFVELRRYIFGSQEELMRFRQLIVNNVLATDIFDKENRQQRKARWDKAFHDVLESTLSQDTINNLRATIIMEHIMQASDVSHTMQHWHVYVKWNRKLFTEMYQAWKDGRMSADPREFWYKGELGFFDNYVIPLAKKLRECNVFGVSSDEYLGYALRNRAEWEDRGKEMIRTMIADFCERGENGVRRGSVRVTLAATEAIQ